MCGRHALGVCLQLVVVAGAVGGDPVCGADGCNCGCGGGVMGPPADIYVSIVSSAHMVAPEGKFVAIVSTTVRVGCPPHQPPVRPGPRVLAA